MSIQRFRTSFRGFNREDVVNYIEYMNNQHKSQVEQLNNQLKAARDEIADGDMKARLEAAEARCAQLEAELAQYTNAEENAELEVYRRAERVERQANERAQQVYDQANAMVAEASVKMGEAAAQIQETSGQLEQYLQAYLDSVTDAKSILSDAQQALGAVKIED